VILGQTGFGCIALPALVVILLGLAVIRKMGWLRVTDRQFLLIAVAVAVLVVCGGSFLFAYLIELL
jgi:hypothetical protein